MKAAIYVLPINKLLKTDTEIGLLFKKKKKKKCCPILTASNTIFERHQERIDVLETLKLSLIDALNNPLVIRCQLHGFVCKLGREMRQIAVRIQARHVRRSYLLPLQLSR